MTPTTLSARKSTTMATRRYYNPVQKDYVTFIATNAETGGERTVHEIELATGGGNVPHYHRTFSERFEVLEGELEVRLGKSKQCLKVGESIIVPANTLHCFGSPTQQHARFLVEQRPGHAGFERTIQIAYGLASDGKTNAKGVPTNVYHIAVLFELGESYVPGVLALLTPILRFLAARARKKGIEQELISTYCQ